MFFCVDLVLLHFNPSSGESDEKCPTGGGWEREGLEGAQEESIGGKIKREESGKEGGKRVREKRGDTRARGEKV